MKSQNHDEDIKPNAEKDPDDLIQSGIVADISSIKEQGLEHADKVCKYISFSNFIYLFSFYFYTRYIKNIKLISFFSKS